MSTANPASQPSSSVTPDKPTEPLEFRVYGHTTLFYWWPVWVLGYALGVWTLFYGDRMALVPEGSEYRRDVDVVNEEKRDVVMLPLGKHLPDSIEDRTKAVERVHPSKNLGVVFSLVLLLVIGITNVPLRGLWWAVFIVFILFLVVLFAYLKIWDDISDLFGKVSIHMNMGFYFFFSTALLIVWSLSFFVFDRMNYWRFRPGQVTHEFVVGGGERTYNSEGMSLEKLRDDVFRHIFLGLGSGDIRMMPRGGADEEVLYIANVLNVSRKLKKIQQLIAIRPDWNKSEARSTKSETNPKSQNSNDPNHLSLGHLNFRF